MNNYTSAIMSKAKRVFFIGIGGISMSSLAIACQRRGFEVSGSDRTESGMTEHLRSLGINVYFGHDAKNIDGADTIVYTGAISQDNPELAAAKGLGLPVIYRAELLGWLMTSYKCRIGVSGMHGKSTATSMISHVFISAGLNPTVMSGAETREMNGACRFGADDFFIFEACEYKDSFLDMFPTVAVLLNIDIDHTDYFSGIDAINSSFEKFAQIPFSSGAEKPAVVACGDDERTLAIAEKSPFAVTFGINNEKCDYKALNITDQNGFYSFDVAMGGDVCGKVKLKVPGRHNIYNALAAFATGELEGIHHDKICSALSDFSGTLRRFEYKGECEGASVYIDYAHHPTEINAAIAAAKDMTRGKQLTVIFEPHTYSRTAAHFDGFAKALSGADLAVLVDIYAAREINESGVSSSALADAVPGACYAPSYESAASLARSSAERGGMILVLGAGTVYKIADMLL